MKTQNTPVIRFRDRTTGEICEESVMGNKALLFAYESALGRTLWSILFGSGFVSRVMGAYYDSPRSLKAAESLAAIPGCDPDEAEKPLQEYQSFNDFFTRKLKENARPADMTENVLVSPGDGRLLVFPECQAEDAIPVKGAKKTVRDLCLGDVPEGTLSVAVLRLAPVDYHRYHYPCDAVQKADPAVFSGKYHSVNPIALRHRPDLFVENTRQVTALASLVFGDMRMIEVGAFGVGTIRQTSSPGEHRKMEEKGMFLFGGSTVILVMQSNTVTFDADLVDASAQGMETRVKCGMRIAAAR